MKHRNLLTLLLLLLPLWTVAQTADTLQPMRIGYVSRQQLIDSQDESKAATQQIDKRQKEYEQEYRRMELEYNGKVKHYIENSKTMSDPIRLARMTEITELEKRLVLFKERYTEDLQQLRDSLFATIIGRVDAAIRLVAENNGIDYVFNQGTELYVSSRCVDLNAMVQEVLNQK